MGMKLSIELLHGLFTLFFSVHTTGIKICFDFFRLKRLLDVDIHRQFVFVVSSCFRSLSLLLRLLVVLLPCALSV